MKATRKNKKIRYMTVDSLHASFERIDAKVRHMISKGCTNQALEQCIRRLWSQQFHQALSSPAMKGMITHYRSLYGEKSGKQTRKQVGGMAPMDWTMGQGSTDMVYGRFPVFEGSSPKFVHDLGTVNRAFESSIGPACTAQAGGTRRRRKNQRGGAGIFDSLSYGLTGGGVGESVRMGHAMPSVPPNTLQKATGAFQASPVPGRSDPTDPAWKMRVFNPQPFDAKALTSFELSPVYRGY
jgi:hypothetical protein